MCTRRPRCAVARAAALLFIAILCGSAPAAAQDEPPRIGPFVADVRGTVPLFKQDVLVATSRGLTLNEMPGPGLGADVGVHAYLMKWKAITFGLGGQLTTARSHRSPVAAQGTRGVTEHFRTLSAQLSLNFGSGDGWSYLSGGVGPSWWSIVPDGDQEGPADRDKLRALNYGGGARWFAKPHLAFTFDVRFYQIDPGFPHGDLPGSPRTQFLAVGAGVSVR